MKLTYEDKVEIYRLWKEQYFSPRNIAKQYKIGHANIEYLIKLIDIHGNSIAKHKSHNKYFI